MAGEFKPTPEEFRLRKKLLDWMDANDWHTDIQDAVFYHNMPEPVAVVRLIRQHGPVKAYKIICDMWYD